MPFTEASKPGSPLDVYYGPNHFQHVSPFSIVSHP